MKIEKLLFMLVVVACLAVAGVVRAEVVLDVTFGHLAFDVDGLTADGQIAIDSSGNEYHGFLGGGSGAVAIAGPTGSTAIDTVANNVYVILRDGRTYSNHGEPSIADPIVTPSPYFNFSPGVSYTFEAVLNWQGDTNGRDGIMGQIKSHTADDSEWWFRENSGTLQFLFRDAGSNQVVTAVDISELIANNEWHHVAVVLDRSSNEIRTYFDYELILTDTQAGIADLTSTIGTGEADIKLGGYNTSSANRFDGFQDHYRISTGALSVGEFISINGAAAPSPADGTVDVVDGTQIGWAAGIAPEGEAVTGHYVYLGTDPMAMELLTATALPVSTLTFDPGTLVKDNRYYWRVDESIDGTEAGDPNTMEGMVWSFQTELSLPIITADPADAVVGSGEDAMFAVAAENPGVNGMTYQWYLDPDPEAGGDEVMLSDGADYSGAGSEILTVLAAELADEAYYFCEVTNAGGTTASDVGFLAIKRLVSHYPLDSDAIDTIDGLEGVVAGDPNYVSESIVGDGSVELIRAPEGIAVPSSPLKTDSWTLSMWSNSPTGSTNQGLILASGAAAGDETLFIRRWQTANYTGSIASTATGAVGPYLRGEWHLHTVTSDGATGRAVWYIDGLEVATVDGIVFAGMDSMIYLGGRKTHPEGDDSRYFIGKLDDLMIYNYALDQFEVAGLYTTVQGGTLCPENPVGDLNGDCEVTLADLEMFVATWLECNLYPDCITVIQ